MKLSNYISNYIKETKYNIGFVEDDLSAIMEGKSIKINWLKHNYKDRWFADPFIMDITDNEIIVLVEEWYDPIQRGRISKLTINKTTYQLQDLKVMIDSGSHLSFPAIERKADGLYIHPENSEHNCLEEYKYNSTKDIFEKIPLPLSTLPLTDSICNDFFGEHLMFSTKLPDANGKELGIYYWNKDKHQYVIKEYYYFEENLARMAGNFYEYKGNMYRPAQVCIKSYGDAVSIQKVTHNNGRWNFKEVRRLYSPHPDLDIGFHTFNIYKDTIVVDALGYRRAKLCHFLRKIKGIF